MPSWTLTRLSVGRHKFFCIGKSIRAWHFTSNPHFLERHKSFISTNHEFRKNINQKRKIQTNQRHALAKTRWRKPVQIVQIGRFSATSTSFALSTSLAYTILITEPPSVLSSEFICWCFFDEVRVFFPARLQHLKIHTIFDRRRHVESWCYNFC